MLVIFFLTSFFFLSIFNVNFACHCLMLGFGISERFRLRCVFMTLLILSRIVFGLFACGFCCGWLLWLQSRWGWLFLGWHRRFWLRALSVVGAKCCDRLAR